MPSSFRAAIMIIQWPPGVRSQTTRASSRLNSNEKMGREKCRLRYVYTISRKHVFTIQCPKNKWLINNAHYYIGLPECKNSLTQSNNASWIVKIGGKDVEITMSECTKDREFDPWNYSSNYTVSLLQSSASTPQATRTIALLSMRMHALNC